LIVSQLLTLFTTPVIYVLFAGWVRSHGPHALSETEA
jgi:predicted Na+-dependent transporter